MRAIGQSRLPGSSPGIIFTQTFWLADFIPSIACRGYDKLNRQQRLLGDRANFLFPSVSRVWQVLNFDELGFLKFIRVAL
ncbi:MAG: hypothetical protein WCV99_08250 [Sterolibacterium sp.]|jgi:hypothetical protein